jgi:hypothetical protein
MRGEGNHYFGCKHSDDIRKRISEGIAQALSAMTDEERKQRFSRDITGECNPFFGRRHTIKTRQRMSQNRTAAIISGCLSCGSRGRKGTYMSTKTGKIERYDSFFEQLRMQMLDADDSVTFWTKAHDIRIKYEWNGIRHYVPDFQIHTLTKTMIEEIKGYEDPKKLEAKMDALQTYCREHGYEARYLGFEELEAMVRAHFGASIAKLRRSL